MTTATLRQQASTKSISGVSVPDTKLAREITEFVHDTETELLFNHSSRVYYFAALAGKRKELHFDAELLYAGAMFHDLGLMPSHSTANRFEVDSANAAKNFLKQRGVDPQDVDKVWTAIALHTTPGIPEFMHPVSPSSPAVWRWMYWASPTTSTPTRSATPSLHSIPRTPNFKEDIIQAFFDGFHKKPDSTFGTVNADVLADKDAKFQRHNFCSIIRNSAWIS